LSTLFFRLSSWPANAHGSGCNDRKGAEQLFSMRIDDGGHNLRFVPRRKARQPNEYYPWRQTMLPKYQLSKVLICRQQNTLFSICQVQHNVI
jgi:hypothetical protein